MNQLIIDKIKNQLDNENLSYSLENIKKIYNEDKLPYDYKFFNGVIFNRYHTDLYNKNCVEIIFNSICGGNLDYTELLKNYNHRLINWYYQENKKFLRK
jgi:hypothetical protein